jgi:type I restriction enzyme, S subunit
MIDKLRPYPEMKPTGLPLLAVLPTRWEIHRAKYSFREADDRSAHGDEELLSVSHKTGVTPRSQKNITMFMAESYEGHKVCHPGDIVVNTMWAWMAAIGVSRHVGIVSPAYGIYRPRTAERFEPKFLDYLLRTEAYRAEYLRSSRGVTTSRLRLYPPDFLNIPFVQPPLDEQRLIVRFLDWHGVQTAKLVRAKKKIIALLNEQKQAIIHRAVTRGLDPNAKLKPSGIPWLGDVPDGWEVTRLKTCVRNIIQQKSARAAGEIYVALEHIESWSGRLLHRDFESQFDSQVKAFAPGDILFGKLRPYLAKVTRLGVGGVCVGELLVLRTSDSVIDSAFLECRIRTIDFIELVNSSTFGAKMPRADWNFIGNVRIAFPRSLDEQRAIALFIQEATRELTITANQVNDEIALIQEFRTRLIADVVTGKLDVRAIAAGLPETAELEAVDDLTDDDVFDGTPEDVENEEVAA